MSRGTLAVSLNQCLGSLAFPRAPGRAGGPEVEGPELTLTVAVGRASAKARAGDRLWVMTRTMQDERRLQVVRRLSSSPTRRDDAAGRRTSASPPRPCIRPGPAASAATLNATIRAARFAGASGAVAFDNGI